MDLTEIVVKTAALTAKIAETASYYKKKYDETVGALDKRLSSETERIKTLYAGHEEAMNQKLSELQSTIDRETQKAAEKMQSSIDSVTQSLKDRITAITDSMKQKVAEAQKQESEEKAEQKQAAADMDKKLK